MTFMLIYYVKLSVMNDKLTNARIVATARLIRNAVMLVAIELPIIPWLI